MSTVRAFLPITLVLLVLGTGLGILGALVPAAGWALVAVFGSAGALVIALDVRDTYRRNRPAEEQHQ